MFGTNEEQQMTLIERQKMRLVRNGYKNSTLFFKMFFDKWYRRDRYNFICDHIDSYKNINEFRTVVLHNHANWPVAPIHNLYVIQPSGSPVDVSEKPVAADSDARDENILLEKKYLKTYWHYFRVSLGVQAMLGLCVGYGGFTIYTATFNGSVMRCFCGIGIVMQAYTMYLKRVEMERIQERIEPLYKRQIKAYERFSQDNYESGYD